MGILDKFSDITVDNSKRLLPEDMEHCKVEEELFKDNAVYSWHLGDTILRAETAARTAIALWQYQDEIKMLAI